MRHATAMTELGRRPLADRHPATRRLLVALLHDVPTPVGQGPKVLVQGLTC